MADGDGVKRLTWRQNALPFAAVFISLVSLISAIISQAVDRQYKELSVTPYLLEHRYPSQLYVRFTNKGIGPAQLRRIIYSTNTGCYDLTMDNQGSWPKEIGPVQLESVAEFAEKVFAKIPGGFPRVGHIKMTALVPGNVVAVGEDFEFFSLYDPHEIFGAIDRADVPKALGGFEEQKLPFGFEYCSLTGKTCSGINMNYITHECSIAY